MAIYVSVDGPNFSGKSTLVNTLNTLLLEKKIDPVVTTGISKYNEIGNLIHNNGRKFKKDYHVNRLLIAAEKFYTYENVIKTQPLTISDRYLLTCIAYDFLYNQDPLITWGLYKSLPKADLNIVLICSEKELNLRASKVDKLSYTESKFTRKRELEAFKKGIEFLTNKNLSLNVFNSENESPEEISQKVYSKIKLLSNEK